MKWSPWFSHGGFLSHRATPSHHPSKRKDFPFFLTIQLLGTPHSRTPPVIFPLGLSRFHPPRSAGTKNHTLVPALNHFAHAQAELDHALVEASTGAAQTTLVADLHPGGICAKKWWMGWASLGRWISSGMRKMTWHQSEIANGCGQV